MIGTVRSLRRGLGVLLCLVFGTSLVACQNIPQSGPVHAGLQNLDQADAQVQFSVGRPVLGAAAEDIVRGFVAAAASSADDYAVARQFLSRGYADSWDPYFGVLVDEGTQEFREQDAGLGVLGVTAIAEVNAQGSYRPANPGAVTELRYELVNEDGEWRISSAPAGIVLDKNTFAAAWTPQPIYFLSPDDRLISDTRWFLTRTAIGTQVVGELLAGPSVPMRGVLRTAFPEGTVLTAGSVPVVDGIARIEFSSELLNADAFTMELVKRQIGASFQAVPEVTSFELRVNGSIIETGSVIAADSTVPSSQNQYVAVLRGDVFGPAGGAVGAQLPEIGESIGALAPTAVSLAPNRRSAAVLHQERVSWVSPEGQVIIDERPEQLQPGIDRFEYIWTYSLSEPGLVVVTKPGVESFSLGLPGFDSVLPTAIRLSQGGMRIAVLVSDPTRPGHSRVLVAGVTRTQTGQPVGFAEQWATALWAEGEPVDLDWIDDQRFVALTDSGVSTSATQGVLGQFPIASGAVLSASSVSGGGSRSLLRILDDKGRLYAPQGSGWQRQQGDIDLVAKIG